MSDIRGTTGPEIRGADQVRPGVYVWRGSGSIYATPEWKRYLIACAIEPPPRRRPGTVLARVAAWLGWR